MLEATACPTSVHPNRTAGVPQGCGVHRLDYDVTILERACGVRAGGYPSDVRGTAISGHGQVGLLAQVQAKQVDAHSISRTLFLPRTAGSLERRWQRGPTSRPAGAPRPRPRHATVDPA
jgi:hypothetical protein